MKPNPRGMDHHDRWLLGSTLGLLIMSLLMVASASLVISDKQFGYPFYYIAHHAVYLLLAILAGALTARIPLKFWERYSGHLIFLAMLMLILVLIPGIGRTVNGSRRWLQLGFTTLQASEAAKICAVIYLASYLKRFQKEVKEDLIAFVKPMLLLTGIAILLLLEPDFGALAVISVTFLILLFVANVRLWPFSLLFVLVVAALGILAVASPYRVARLTSFLNPWTHQFDSGYQLTQSLIAFGRGGIFGVGLGNSVQKLFYLPEAHTDFLFAVIAEELGLIGELLLIALLIALVGRIFVIAYHALQRQELFAAYIAYGCAAWFGLQSLINIGVSAGLLPTKGLTLPFISYGGSSIIINCAVVGILMRISYETGAAGDKLAPSRYLKSNPKARIRNQ